MAFERFTKIGISHKPRISIRSNGQIGFTLGAIERFALNHYRLAVLFYDKENNKIGIKLTNEAESGACKLQVRPSNASLSAKSFLDYYEIDYSKTERFAAYWDDNEQLIVVSLNKEEE